MNRSQTISLLVCLAALSAAMGLFARESTTDAYEDAMSNTNMPVDVRSSVADGRKLMRLKGVAAGDPACKCSGWEHPNIVELCGAVFSVSNRSESSCFILNDTNGCAVAEADYTGFENEDEAIMWTFAYLADCEAAYTHVARCINVTNICPRTMFIDSPDSSRRETGFGILVHKNLRVKLIAATNRLELALALLNAGLPEGERLNVGQHNVPICEGDR